MTDTLNRLVGCEFEATATTGLCEPIDLRQYLSTPIRAGRFAGVMLDGERDQVELVCDPTRDLREIVEQFGDMKRRALGLAGGDIALHWRPGRLPNLPCANFEGWTKSRLIALREGVCDPREGGVHGEGIVRAGDINAFHGHFGVTDVYSDEATNTGCLLNMAAPATLEYAHTRYGIPVVGRNRVWTKFARPERLPAPRWFPDFEALHSFFESYPRLIRPVDAASGDKHGGDWVVDLESNQVFGDDAADGTVWWAVRWRPKYNTVEFRPLPTFPDPNDAADMVKKLDIWLDHALEALGTRQFADFNEAASSGIIPPFMGIPMPKSEQDWRTRWNRF